MVSTNPTIVMPKQNTPKKKIGTSDIFPPLQRQQLEIDAKAQYRRHPNGSKKAFLFLACEPQVSGYGERNHHRDQDADIGHFDHDNKPFRSSQ
jgi:hypothetical protein